MIPRHQTVLFIVLVGTSAIMGTVLWRQLNRAHQRLLQSQASTPTSRGCARSSGTTRSRAGPSAISAFRSRPPAAARLRSIRKPPHRSRAMW